MYELRCAAKKHANVLDDQIIEIKCNSRFCGAQRGVIVLHSFNVKTRELVDTKKFKTTIQNKE
jgi:hypothetical protein